jgi:hypothetical protein
VYINQAVSGIVLYLQFETEFSIYKVDLLESSCTIISFPWK